MAHKEAYISNPINLIMPSWNAVWLNITSWLGVLGIGAATFAVGLLLMKVVSNPAASLAVVIALYVAVAIKVAPMLFALEIAGVKGHKMSLAQAYSHTNKRGGEMILLLLLTGIVTIVGVFLLVIPGVIFATWFSMAPYVMIEEKLGIMDSIKRSKELAEGRFFEMAGAVFLPSAITILMLIPVLGLLATIVLSVMSIAVLAVRYLQIKEHKGGELPEVHPLNYVVLVLAIIAMFASYRQNQKAKPVDLPGLDYGTYRR